MNKFIFFSITIVISMIPSTMYTQEINVTQLGIKFTLPEGWTGQEQDEYIIAGHTNIPGLMILSQNTSTSIAQLKTLAMQGIYDEGVALRPKGTLTAISEKRLEGSYEGTFQGTQVTGFAIGLIDGAGNGMNILILTEENKFNDIHISEAKKLANSVVLMNVGEKNKTYWESWLVGNKLTYMNTQGGSDYGGGYSGISDKKIVNLCTDGTFNFYFNSHSSFEDSRGMGHVNSNEENIGTYKIVAEGVDTFLLLAFADGASSRYKITENEEGHTLLNGNRYTVTDIEGCN